MTAVPFFAVDCWLSLSIGLDMDMNIIDAVREL